MHALPSIRIPLTSAESHLERDERAAGTSPWRVAIRVALLAFLAFLPVRENDFVDWDDQDNFLQNMDYRGLGPAQLKWAWSTTLLGVYQPIAWMTMEAEYAGWKLNARGYHLVSLFLHVANAVALFWLVSGLLRRAFPRLNDKGDRWLATCAGLATAFFAVHPLRAEVVAWASCQPYLPCALLSILSLITYLKANDEGRPDGSRYRWLAASWLLFVAALLSKAIAVSLPVVMLAIDAAPLGRIGGGRGLWRDPEARRAWIEKLPFAAASLVFMAIAYGAKKSSGMLVASDEAGVMSRLALACHSVWFYPAKTLWPLDLNAYYMRPVPLDWTEPRFVMSMIGVAGMSLALFGRRRQFPALLAAWVAYLAILAPNSGLVAAGKQIAADRYSYEAAMVWSVLGAAGLFQIGLRGRASRSAGLGVGLGVVAVLLVLSFRQSQTWYNSVTLWTHAIEHGSADTPDLHNNVAMIYSMIGDHDVARAELLEALRLRPDYAEAHRNLGLVYRRQGNQKLSVEHLSRAVELDPEFVQARADLASGLTRMMKNDEALTQYLAIAALRPKSAEAIAQLGQSLRRLGRNDQAETRLREALALNPKCVEARRGLNALESARQRRATQTH